MTNHHKPRPLSLIGRVAGEIGKTMFVEISKDYFINLDYVVKVRNLGAGWDIVTANGDEYSVDEDYQTDFCKAIKENASPWEKWNK